MSKRSFRPGAVGGEPGYPTRPEARRRRLVAGVGAAAALATAGGCGPLFLGGEPPPDPDWPYAAPDAGDVAPDAGPATADAGLPPIEVGGGAPYEPPPDAGAPDSGTDDPQKPQN